jgi:hypothetical protein
MFIPSSYLVEDIDGPSTHLFSTITGKQVTLPTRTWLSLRAGQSANLKSADLKVLGDAGILTTTDRTEYSSCFPLLISGP